VKLLDLLLHPTKAARRYSPLHEGLTDGQENELLFMFNRVREGEHRAAVRDERTYASSDPAVCEAYASDSVAYPGGVDQLIKRTPGAVVLPKSESELVELIQFAQDNNVPVVPRGGGTSVHGGAVPTEGGVIADMRAFDDVLEVDEDDQIVRVRAGMTWQDLDERLAEHGLTTRCEPFAAQTSTIGGALAMGKAGFGSYSHGSIRDNVEEVELMTPELETETRRGADLDLVEGCQGSTGFITEATIRVQEDTGLVPTGAAFDSMADVERYVGGLPHEGVESLHVLGPDHVDLKMEPDMARALPKKKFVVVHAIDEEAREELVPDLQARVETLDGDWIDASDASWEWERRHRQRNFQQFGPSLVVAEAKCPREELAEAWRAGREAIEAREFSIWAVASGPDEFKLVANLLADERLPNFPLAWGNRLAFLDAVKDEGGSATAPGLLTPGDAKSVLGKDRVKQLSQWKKEHDAEDIMNPGKVLAGRVKGMPIVPTTAAVVPGTLFMKSMRQQFDHRRESTLEPSNRALNSVMGRRLSKRLARIGDDLYADTRLGPANRTGDLHRGISFEKERPRSVVKAVRFDTQLPRGVVAAGRAILEGKTPGEQVVSHALSLPAVPTYENHAETPVPILEAIEAVREAGQAASGLNPSVRDIVETLDETNNVLGEDPETRGDWMPGAPPSGPDTSTLLFAGDRAAAERTDDALSTFNVLTNASFGFGTLGADEPHPGTVPYRLGAFDAAQETAQAFADEATSKLDQPPTTLVALSSEDADVLERRLADLLEDGDHEDWNPRVLTATEVTASLAKAGRLTFQGQGDDEDADGEAEDPENGDEADEDAEAEEDEPVEEDEEGFEHLDVRLVHSPFADDNERSALEDLAERIPDLDYEIADTSNVLLPDAAYQVARPDQTEALMMKAKAELAGDTLLVGCVDLAHLLDEAGLDVQNVHDVVVERMEVSEGGAQLAEAGAADDEDEFEEFEIPDDANRVELVKENAAIPVYDDESILDAAERHGFDLPFDCRAGSCVTCCAKYEGAEPEQSEGQVLGEDEQETHVLTCIGKPTGDVKIWSGEEP